MSGFEAVGFSTIYQRNSLGLWLLAAGIVLQGCACAALAGDATPVMTEARRLLDAGEAEKAATLLEGDLLALAGDADYDYLLGLALYRAGRNGQALFAFERVVMVEPNNVDARLKAVQINAELGNGRFAEELLEPLAKQRLGSEQQREMERARAEIAAGGKAAGLSIRGYVLAGTGWDDNVTSGPAQSELVIPALNPRGLGTTPMGSAARDRDIIGMVEAGVTLRQALGQDTWLSGSGSVRQGFNRARKDMKESIANFDLGVMRRLDNDFWGLNLLSQDYLLSDTVYRKSLGSRLSWIHPLDDHSRLSSYLQQVVFDFPNNSQDNATRRMGGAARESTLDGGTKLLQYGFYGGQEDANLPDKPHFSYRLWGVHLGGSLLLGNNLSVTAAALFESRHYIGEDKLYLYMRRDQQLSVGLSADYRFNERWHLLPQYTHTHNASTTELYEYARNTFMVQLKWDFDNEK